MGVGLGWVLRQRLLSVWALGHGPALSGHESPPVFCRAAEEGLRASVWAAGARGPAFLVQAGGDLKQPFPGTDSAAPPRSTCNIRAAGGLVAALGFPWEPASLPETEPRPPAAEPEGRS